ncbi:MAG: tetraacyldisaccharide 4'-kinase [Planctomycetota bacterium]
MLKNLWTQAVLEKRLGPGWTGLRIIFSWLSLPYYLAIAGRLWLYRLKLIKPVKLPVPVISVGNITAGGTGKTPMVISLAEKLAGQGKKVGILSRGYGRIKTNQQKNINRPAACLPIRQGRQDDDEDFITSEPASGSNQPNPAKVFRLTGVNRLKSGYTLIHNYGVDTIIIDDGFQHLKLHRDINLLMIDCLNPFGHRRLLPAGLLREPLSGLQRADIFILTRTDLVNDEALKDIESYLKKFNKPVIKSIHRPVNLTPLNGTSNVTPAPLGILEVVGGGGRLLTLDKLAGKKYFGFCGIGNPVGFQKTLERLSGQLTGLAVFPDHHLYQTDNLKQINLAADEKQAELLITTEKDTKRLKCLLVPPPAGKETGLSLPVYALKIELVITEG